MNELECIEESGLAQNHKANSGLDRTYLQKPVWVPCITAADGSWIRSDWNPKCPGKYLLVNVMLSIRSHVASQPRLPHDFMGRVCP